ncbi:PREDICTED: GATA zinc finger domain-containing protein 7 [Polistes dominula]|uniref:GATA zinc finger domain-containing protein 7 n=1 Tax=Polistes dominula TaxID=743375 RepID=A0ABM1J9H9_POLDO|nr:PREDICTED: GATA zinc finger domain-containing protein 7 [Polistes dominula]
MPPSDIANTIGYKLNNNAKKLEMNTNTFPESRNTNTLMNQNSNNSIQSKPSIMAYNNVYVNPYFKPQNPVVHINPNMHIKPLIHVNPKMVQNVTTSTNNNTINNTSTTMNYPQENLTQMDLKKLKLHAAGVVAAATAKLPSIHVNPKIMNSINNSNVTTENNYKCDGVTSSNNKKCFIRTDVKKSVYVNPKLMSKLSSSKESKTTTIEKKDTIPNLNQPSCSRLKFVRKIDNTKTPVKKLNNMSNILVLSKRKLIRAKRTMKENTVMSPLNGPNKVKRPSLTKKIKTTTVQSTNNVTNNNALQSTINNVNNLSKINNGKRKINQYKIDRTVKALTEPNQNEVPPVKKSKYDLMELVTIGGIVYKSSRNQLVRRSYSLKKKLTANTKRDKFIIATNGKKLCRLKLSSKDTPNKKNVHQTNDLKLSSVSNNFKTTYKKNISNKVKQRSIQILRNKMRKNNQPCLFFQRFGYCANEKKGTCSKLHDKKQISVCKKFLQGKCMLDSCPLSHDVGPEKMPTCKYFLEACCLRDQCPYRHVKVSSSTPICIEFLQGYCSKGNECKLQHEHLCPEYSKTGNCNKGKKCPYPHKPITSTARQIKKYIQKKPKTINNQNESNIKMKNNTEQLIMTNHECCKLRYYENTDQISTDLNTKRDNIIKQIQLMKNVALAEQSDEVSVKEELTANNNVTEQQQQQQQSSISENESTNCLENTLPKRLPLGVLPAFIPIN